MKQAMTILAALVMAGSMATEAEARGRYYYSSDGSTAHVPYRGRHRGETAIRRDGTHSMSHHHRGTCSHHGGVRRFER